jgi:hypothetical protein
MDQIEQEFNKKINIKVDTKKKDTIKKDTIKKDTIKNKGTGAGGKNTNKSGKSYEQTVDYSNYLIFNGFESILNNKYNYLSKSINNLEILFFQQRELKKYLYDNFNKKIFRIPDQAILKLYKDKKPKLIIIEIKYQNTPGSVDDKLWAGIAIKKNYQYWLDNFDIEYNFILSTYLFNLINENKKKYNGLKQLLEYENIKIFHGSDINFEENIYKSIIYND